MYLTELARRLCTQDLYPFVLQNKKKLMWTIKYSFTIDYMPDSDEVVTSRTMKAIWKYITRFKRLPVGPQDVKGYIVTNPDHIKEFSRGGEDGEKDETTETLQQLDTLTTWNPPTESVRGLESLMVLENAFSKVRGAWHSVAANQYSKIANGMDSFKWFEKGEKKEERGPAPAMRWLRMKWLEDYTDDTPPVDGFLHQNMQVVREGFANLMNEQNENGRMLLGLDNVDKCVVIGKQTDNRFIGIVGQANDGKTTLANYIVYNWLRQGFNGLYVSTEHTSKRIWDVMTYLHSSHPDYGELVLPPTKEWENRNVTSEHIRHMQDICFDIENGRNLPGKLEVKEFPNRDWDSIEDWLKLYHSKNHYDFLLLDYITRLEIPGDPRWKDQGMKELIHRIQKFTRQFDESRGIIVMSPVQITKESYKEAMKGDFKEGIGHYTLDAIRTFSELKDDMDVILTVWSDIEMKAPERNEIEIGCVKKRVGAQPLAQIAVISPWTGAFVRKGAAASEQRPLTTELKQVIQEVRNIDSEMADTL
jgi:GTPase SAR1 family protein